MLLALAKSAALYGAVVAAKVGRRAAATAAGYLVVASLFAVGVCFLTLSGYRAILHVLGDVYASLIIGCLYLVAGLVAMLVLEMRRR